MPKHNLLISGICSAIVFFGLLVSLQVFQATRSINNDTMELVDKKIPLLKEIEKLKQVITERERILYEYYATTDQSAAHKSLREVEILIDLYIADLKVLLPNNTEINTFDSLNNSIFAVTRELDANLGKRQGKNWDLAREQLEAITAYGRQIHPALDMLEQAATAAADEQRELTIEQGENMKLSILAYAFVICLIALGVAYISSRYLITAEEKRKAHEKLSFLATHDEELGIANRNQLEIDVNSAEHQDITAIVLLKLDNIERYSNSYGFPFVEQLIQHASNRLKQEDFDGELYRFNDSTLALLLNGDFRQASEPLASQLQNLFSSPVDTSEGPFYLSLSMGYVRCSEANYEFSTLIKYAETALTKSIISGGKTMSTFTKDMYSQEKYRFAMEQELQNAVENNELHLFYQAKVGANDNTTIGYEALIRWKRNQSEWVPPFEFIPLAEQSGQILEIGSWVIQEACKQIKLWREQGFENFTIAVNISPRQFQHHAFLSTLVNIVEEAEIPPACLRYKRSWFWARP